MWATAVGTPLTRWASSGNEVNNLVAAFLRMSGEPREVIDLCSPDLPIVGRGGPARKRARIVIPSFDLGSDSDLSEESGEEASNSTPADGAGGDERQVI